MAELVKVYIIIVTLYYLNDPKNAVLVIESEEYEGYPSEVFILHECMGALIKFGKQYRCTAKVEERYNFKE
jgi:hypothetical protein